MWEYALDAETKMMLEKKFGINFIRWLLEQKETANFFVATSELKGSQSRRAFLLCLGYAFKEGQQ